MGCMVPEGEKSISTMVEQHYQQAAMMMGASRQPWRLEQEAESSQPIKHKQKANSMLVMSRAS